MSDANTRSIFYDLDGMPIDLEQGQELMKDWDSRLVAETQIETVWGTMWLATVHMVMDQADQLFEEHVPVLYVTRIHGAVPRRDITGFRGKYATRPHAFAGHMAVLHDLIRDLGGDILTVWQKPIRRVA